MSAAFEHHGEVDVTFPSERTAEVVFRALSVEKDLREDRCSREMKIHGLVLHMYAVEHIVLTTNRSWNAASTKFLRTSMLTFMDSLHLAVQTARMCLEMEE